MRSGYIFCNTTRCKLELLQDWDGGKNLWCLWGSWWMSKHVFGPHPFSFELRYWVMGCICKIAIFRHCVGLIDHQNVIAKAMASVHVKQMCYHNFCTKWLVSFPALYQRWVFSWFFLFRLVFMSYVMLWKRGETADWLRITSSRWRCSYSGYSGFCFSQSEEVETLDPSLFVSMRQTISQALLHSFTA